MTTPPRVQLTEEELRQAFCFGVAGNFAGHLEQAGEAGDFANVAAAAAMPKGIFPWFVPGHDGQLGVFPISSDALVVPATRSAAPTRVQLEPELAVLCDVVRDGAGRVAQLRPRWIGAFDDCSLRRPGARKISDKKNWGVGSKGLAGTGFAVSDLDRDGSLATVRIASFLVRNGQLHPYGVDSAASTYSLAGAPLLAWLVERLAHQRGSDDTPLEDVGALLDASAATQVVVGVGATRYEPYGETTFVQPGDEAVVVIYDARSHEPGQLVQALHERRDADLRGASVLRRVAQVAAE